MRAFNSPAIRSGLREKKGAITLRNGSGKPAVFRSHPSRRLRKIEAAGGNPILHAKRQKS
jgi:hypothetical protein